MRRLLASWAGPWLAPVSAWASDRAGSLQLRIDTSELTSTDLLLATLHNDYRVLYAALSTAGMAVFAVVTGLAVDALLGRLGLPRLAKLERTVERLE